MAKAALHQHTGPAWQTGQSAPPSKVIQLPLATVGDAAPTAAALQPSAQPQEAAPSLSAVVERLLTTSPLQGLVTQGIVSLQASPAAIDAITQRLYQHLVASYQQQLSHVIEAEGLSAIDPTRSPVRLRAADAQGPQRLELLLSEPEITRYLATALVDFFKHPAFEQAFGRFLGTHLITWSLDELGVGTLDDAAIAAVCRRLQASDSYLARKTARLSAIYSLEIAQMVVDSLGLADCSLSRLETLMGLTVPPPITLDDRLDLPKITPIPTAIPIASSIRAQLRPDLWQRQGDVAVFQYHSRGNPANYIEHYITDPGDIALLPWEAAEQIINKFGFDTVKLQMIFAAKAMDQAEPWNSTFRLRATDIVQLLGWDRNHNTSLPEKRTIIASAAHALSCLLVKSVWIEGRGKRRIDASTPVGRMWDVLVDPHGQIDWVTGKIESPDEVYITVTPGLWTKHFLNRAGHKATAALHQFGYLARDILRIDPYHHEMALRLAIQLTLDARVRVHNQHPYNYQVMALLKEVIPATEIERALADKYRARDLKNRWNRALTLLISLGWQIEYDSQSYPDWLRPNSDTPRPPDWRRIKIIERLLQAHLVIRPPQPIPQLLAQVKAPRRLKNLKKSPARSLPGTRERSQPAGDVTGDEVREGRKARGWSRKELGGFLGVSADYVGKLERGDRVITPPLQKRLRKLLALP
ncbi:MAG: helix-turn-helix transcriptional regulator [Cyanobacteria bacterium P01_A01_bin.135]